VNSKIHAFAEEYLKLYKDPKSNNIQVEEGFAEKCFSLGFEMDAGHSFCEKYAPAFNSYEELEKIIDEIDDPQFLGTAIFSQWRYITHWCYCNLLDKDNRKWFIIALQRLITITSEEKAPPYVFFGNIRKVKIHSNNICFGDCPRVGREVEQHLTITEDGRVWITRYAFKEDLNFADYTKTEQRQYRIDPEKARFLLDKYTRYFRDMYEPSFATDVGCYEMWIEDDEGKKAYFMGPLISEYTVDKFDLSQLTRDTLDDQTLFVFDDNAFEQIKRITIDYRFTKQYSVKDIDKPVTWNCSDHIVLDRDTETIEAVSKYAEQCDVSRKYHVEGGVSSFLDNYECDSLFTEFEEVDENVILPTEGVGEYGIKVEFYRGEPRIINGRYDKLGLPTDWTEFINDLRDLLSFYGLGLMFDESQYERTYRKKGDLIFLSVRFGDYGKSYYYLTDDDSIEVGDQVVVPVGHEGTERIVEVVKKQYFAPDSVPMPIEKVKSIVEKFVRSEDKMLYCPMCECEISEDDCYDVLYDPCTEGIEGIITAEEIDKKRDICTKCRYYDD